MVDIFLSPFLYRIPLHLPFANYFWNKLGHLIWVWVLVIATCFLFCFVSTCSSLSFFFLKILFIFRERGREGEREGKKHQCMVASHTPHLWTWPTTQACALTGNWTINPLVQRPALSPLSYTSQGPLLVQSLDLEVLSELDVLFWQECFIGCVLTSIRRCTYLVFSLCDVRCYLSIFSLGVVK